MYDLMVTPSTIKRKINKFRMTNVAIIFMFSFLSHLFDLFLAARRLMSLIWINQNFINTHRVGLDIPYNSIRF